MSFCKHKTFKAIAFGEAFDNTFTMFLNPPREITGDADIERSTWLLVTM